VVESTNAAKVVRFPIGLALAVSSAHFVHDVFTSFLAPLLPLIIEKLGLSLVMAGSLAVFSQLPSVFNPPIGALADRRGLYRLFVIIAPGATGCCMCLIGLAPSYAALVVLLLTSGLSLAAMHVAGPVVIGKASENAVGRGMSFFMAGGALARTAGPLIAVHLVSTLGLEGLWKVIPVAVASSLLLWWQLSDGSSRRRTSSSSGMLQVLKEMRLIIFAVFGILMARAFLVGGLSTFLPTFIYGEEGGSLWMANIALSVLELSSAAGAFTAGTLSDRIGRRKVLFFSVAASPVLMLAFLHSSGPLRLLALAGLGFVNLSIAPVVMAMMIENSRANPATANGIYMMISFAARALIILAVGAMGDHMGLRSAYLWCAGFATFGLPFVFLLPRGVKSTFYVLEKGSEQNIPKDLT
jgi:FSR family fosmidomycin resistance protein-like MFS transporter